MTAADKRSYFWAKNKNQEIPFGSCDSAPSHFLPIKLAR